MRSLEEHAQTRYFACFALALSATMGVAFSANLFTLFLFYEALTLATYPLVGHKETAEAKAGARKYVIYLLGAAKVFLMAAIILTYNVAGTLEFRKGGILPASALAAEPTLLYRRICPVPVWFCQERRDAVAQLAAGRHGGPDAGQRAPACRGRGEDRGLRHTPRLPVRFRRRGHAASRRRQTGVGRRLGDDSCRLAPGPRPGQPEGPTGLLDDQPAFLHRPGRGAADPERDPGRDCPHHESRRIEDHALPVRRFDLRFRAQDRCQPDVRAGQADAVDHGRVCRSPP